MKIQLDLSEILAGEWGTEETLEQSLVRQVVRETTSALENTIRQQVDERIAAAVEKVADEVCAARIEAAIDRLLHTEYEPVDHYGSKSPPTTLMQQLHSTLVSQCVFNNRASSYDQNAYTRAVQGAIDVKLAAFKTEFSKHVDDAFVGAAIKHATEELRKKLGITK